MNCNKKSHFDGMTPVHRQVVGGQDLVMSLFAGRRCCHKLKGKEDEIAEARD